MPNPVEAKVVSFVPSRDDEDTLSCHTVVESVVESIAPSQSQSGETTTEDLMARLRLREEAERNTRAEEFYLKRCEVEFRTRLNALEVQSEALAKEQQEARSIRENGEAERKTREEAQTAQQRDGLAEVLRQVQAISSQMTTLSERLTAVEEQMGTVRTGLNAMTAQVNVVSVQTQQNGAQTTALGTNLQGQLNSHHNRIAQAESILPSFRRIENAFWVHSHWDRCTGPGDARRACRDPSGF